MNKLNRHVHGFRVAMGVVAMLLSLCVPDSLYGQAVTGSLLGTISEATGAVIPGATVVITEVDTNISRSVVANEDGNYVFTNLKPGVYRVEAENTGFKKTVVDRVEVQVNSSVRTDLALQPGALTENVTVTMEQALLQTDRADVGRKIEGKQVVDLPLPFNRNFQGLLNLVPGTQRAFRPHSEFFNPQDSLSTRVNGQSRLANNVQVEGIDNNHRTGLLTVLIPPIEAIQTVDVTTSNYEAELGRAGGAVTNVALKSGTNDFRGSVFAFNRVSALAARNFFAATKAPTTYNLFGFTFGGPIIKNRTFFFGDYQGVRDHRGTVHRVQIPTLAFRNGDFRGAPTTIYDPAMGNANGTGRQQFQCNGVLNVICPERISPIARRILSFIPDPTSSNLTGPNFERNTVRVKDTNSFDVKINHEFTDNDNVSVRYSYQKPEIFDPGLYGIYGGPANGGFAGTGSVTTQSGGANYTHVFNSRLITEVRFGFSRYRNDVISEGNGLTTSTDIGIPGANIDEWSSGLSSIDITGYGNPVVGFSASLPWIRAETNFNLVNNWTNIFGNHTLKFGVDGRVNGDDLQQTQTFNPRGVFNFRPGTTSLSGGQSGGFANAFASFLLDLPNQVGRDLPVIFPALRQKQIFTYVQDKWQVSQKLTVDIGLRHEYYDPLRPRYEGGLSNYDPQTNTLRVAGVGDVPMNIGVKRRFTNFNPRLGLAYRLNDKTVLRGGFGISTIPFPDNSYAFNYPVKQNNSFDAPNAFSAAAGSSLATGFPGSQVAAIPSNGIIPATSPFLINQAYDVVPLDLKEGYIQSWNITVQRSLPWKLVFEAAYVGNRGNGILGRYNLNAGLIPGAGAAGQPLNQLYGRRAATNTWLPVSNNYNSLQVKFDRRLADGLILTTAYTFSKAIDYGTGDNGTFFNQINVRENRARASFDRTHNYVQSFVYELPFGSNRRFLNSSRVANWFIGGWQVNGIFTASSGEPLNFTISGTSLNAPGNNNRPDLLRRPEILRNVGSAGVWFDPAAFAAPSAGRFGTAGRNILAGPGFVNLDFSAMKKFAIKESKILELRAESFNFTNTPHFDNPSGDFSGSTFGRVTSAQQDQRQFQLGVKFIF